MNILMHIVHPSHQYVSCRDKTFIVGTPPSSRGGLLNFPIPWGWKNFKIDWKSSREKFNLPKKRRSIKLNNFQILLLPFYY